MHRILLGAFSLALALALPVTPQVLAQEAPVKALGRFDGWRDNALVGYGLVTGLSGSGDSRSSAITRQALRNALSRLGTMVSPDDISSRNVAVVMVTAMLPPSSNIGDHIDVTVSSAGDARSLAGGTLLMTTLVGPDQQVYALAQGPLVVGGYQFEAQQNMAQRNYPTTGRIVQGGTIEQSVNAKLVNARGEVTFILAQPDFETAQQISTAVERRFGAGKAHVENADRIVMSAPSDPAALASFIATVEGMGVRPARQYRVVVNERTGTVVAGGDVMVSPVVISQGDIRVTIETRNDGYSPYFQTGRDFTSGRGGDISRLLVSDTKLTVEEGKDDATIRLGSTTIGDLVQGLSALHVGTRRIISILQALKTAGALHADVIVE